MRREQQTSRPEKRSNFFRGNNFPKLNRYSLLWIGMMAITGIIADGGENNPSAKLKALKITDGKILSLKYDTSSTVVVNEKTAYKNLPPRTVVKLILHPAKGSNINVEIWLPNREKWNGRFLGTGTGGAAGHIRISPFTNICAGYAVANTDMGTSPNSNSGIGNREVWKDFGFRATHLMTVVAKQIIKAYYGKDPEYSYFCGRSTGGQQALQEAQRYPDDYDGILAEVPAHCRTPLHAYFLWNYQIFQECPFSDSQERNIIDAANEYMAAREVPQIAGKLVSDPRCTKRDIEAIIVLAREKDLTLTEKHVEALRKLFDGPRHAVTGERIYGGIPVGASFKRAHSNSNLYLFKWVFGKSVDFMKINFGKDIDRYTAELGPYLNAQNPDLSEFEKRGGKIIMFAGSADSCVPYHGSVDYYERVIGFFGSLNKVRSFFRFYIVPGMNHGLGQGINRPLNINTLRKWREQSIVPDRIQARRIENGKTVIDIPLYPYPDKTVWKTKNGFERIQGPRGGTARIAERFLPSAEE